MDTRIFGTLPSGQAVEAVTLTSASGACAEILTLGGVLRRLLVHDRNGHLGDVVLGFDTLEDYLEPRLCMGSIVGRIAGRVSGGRILADDRIVELHRNHGTNHLHGGPVGFDRRLWTIEGTGRTSLGDSVALRYHSPDGEEGYPGTVEVTATYTLTPDSRLVFETEVTADRTTPVSLTQHAYFDLSAGQDDSILDHVLQVNASEYVPVDESLTLTNRREPVFGTGADLTDARRLREAIPGFLRGHGDHYLVPTGTEVIASVLEPKSGRFLQLSTTHTSLQLYTGYAIPGGLTGKSGRAYGAFSGLCLECEGYPNGSTVPELGDILVHPGEPQKRRTVFAFSTC